VSFGQLGRALTTCRIQGGDGKTEVAVLDSLTNYQKKLREYPRRPFEVVNNKYQHRGSIYTDIRTSGIRRYNLMDGVFLSSVFFLSTLVTLFVSEVLDFELGVIGIFLIRRDRQQDS
jgi:hypothetical protein